MTMVGMLTCMDAGIGKVRSALEEKGMWDNTLLVFVGGMDSLLNIVKDTLFILLLYYSNYSSIIHIIYV